MSLEIDGLKPNRVVYVRSPRPFEAEGGEPLLSTEAWYTLNKLPGYVAPADGLYELEDGQLTGGAQFDTEHAGYTGAGFVSGFGTVGAAVAVDVERARGGRLPDGAALRQRPEPVRRPEDDHPDRERQQPPDHAAGDGSLADLPALRRRRHARRGREHDRARARGRATTATSTSTRCASRRRASCATRRRRATLAGGATVETEHAGFSGDGYVGGYEAEGASTTFDGDRARRRRDGRRARLRERRTAPAPATVSLYVNDQFVKKLALPDTGGWDAYGTLSDTLRLRAGSNDDLDPLRRGRRRRREPRLPRRHAERAGAVPARRSSPDDEFDGEALDRCRWSTILDEDPSGYSPRRRQAADQGAGGRHRRHDASRARNVVLQQAPADGSWSATTKLSIDGADDYLQGGIVAHASASDWGKLVVMRKPAGEWVLELARASGYQNSAALPAGAQDGITLQLFASEGRLRGRYSLDDGATWTEVGTGFPLTGLSSAGHRARRVQRHRRGGRRVRVLPRRRAAARSRDVHAGHAGTGLHDAVRRDQGERRGLAHGGPGLDLPGERLHAVHRGWAGAAVALHADRPRLLAQARLEARRRRQLGRVRRLPRPGDGSVGRGRPRLRDPDRRHRRSRTARPARSTTSRRPTRRPATRR